MSTVDIAPDDPYETTAPDPLTLLERSVVGTAMAYKHAIPELMHEVAGGDFHDPRLGRIFRGICDEHAEGRPVDFLSISDLLPKWNVSSLDLRDLAAWSGDARDPGIGAHHARMVRAASIRRLMAKVGQALQAPDGDVDLALQRAIDDLHTIGSIGGGGEQPVRWLKDLLAVPESEDAYDWVVPELLERRDRLMLSGIEGGGKSTFTRQIAVLSAAGIHPTKFYRMDPIRALVIDAENSERQWRRSVRPLAEAAAQRGARDPRDHMAVHCVNVMDITQPDAQALIHRWIDEVKPDLLLLGPLYRVTRGSLNDDDDVAPVLHALDAIRDRDVAMLIEAHAGHARGERGERELRPRGSSALLGWPEFGLGIRRDKVREGNRSTSSLVRWRGDRDPRDWPTRLTRGQVWPWEPTF